MGYCTIAPCHIVLVLLIFLFYCDYHKYHCLIHLLFLVVAKEASDIVIMDDNFASIVKAVMWGRSVFDNIRKFLQFQLTVNVVALTLTFVSAFTGHEPPLNAVMMLWVNMIMDTMGALALGTEPPSLALLDRRPYKRNASLISNTMIRNISVQFFYQMGLLAYLLFLGFTDFNVAEGSRAHFTVIFNAFVFCQIFNEINARSIGNTMNVFHGLSQNPLFLGILAFTVAAQYLLVQFGGEFVRTVALNQDQWLKCVLLGSLSLPIGGLMRLIPVRDRESDFAEVSSLVTAAVASRTTEKSQAIERVHHEESSGDLSFYIWLLTVCTLPVVTYSVFQSSWGVHASAFIAYFK